MGAGRDRRFDMLLQEVCVGLGWCGSVKDGKPLHVTDFIPASGAVTADQFADWLILADACDPHSEISREQKWRERLHATFVRHMGAETVDASELQYHFLPPEAASLRFREDDLTGEAVQGLVRRHLAGMHENSPPESVHAFDIDKLRQPGVTFWSGWVGDELAVIGALKELDAENGEIKSMRVADAFLGKDIGRAMLEHILFQAWSWKLKALWLETGSTPAFIPAIKLYESAGFQRCGPFGDYKLDPFSVFMTRTV